MEYRPLWCESVKSQTCSYPSTIRDTTGTGVLPVISSTGYNPTEFRRQSPSSSRETSGLFIQGSKRRSEFVSNAGKWIKKKKISCRILLCILGPIFDCLGICHQKKTTELRVTSSPFQTTNRFDEEGSLSTFIISQFYECPFIFLNMLLMYTVKDRIP